VCSLGHDQELLVSNVHLYTPVGVKESLTDPLKGALTESCVSLVQDLDEDHVSQSHWQQVKCMSTRLY
jgi:hypothetical protein